MNPGYLSYVLVICFIILLLSGWKRELVGPVSTRYVCAAVIFWLIAIHAEWRLASGVAVNGVIFIIAAIVAIDCRSIRSRKQLGYLLLIGLLLALWHGCATYIRSFGPAGTVHPMAIVALGDAIVAGVLLQAPLRQLSAVSIGLVAGMWLEHAVSGTAVAYWGDASFRDQWILAFLLTRLVSLLMHWPARSTFK